MGPRAATLILVVLAALLAAAPAGAATFTVSDGVSDSGPGTLRQAIVDANTQVGGIDPTIRFTTATVVVTSTLPSITRAGTFVDGCDRGRTDPPLNAPRSPALSAPCVTITGPGSGSGVPGLVVKNTSGVLIQNVRIGGFAVGIRLWGASSSRIAANVIGVSAAGTSIANGRGIQVVATTNGFGAVDRAATRNLIGGTSEATGDPAACSDSCNVIGYSTVAGVDLNGGGSDDLPAGGPDGPENADLGTTVKGNWIGVRNPAGSTAPNALAVNIGGSHESTLQDNVISGNTIGVDQGSGTTGTWLIGGVFGLSPDRDAVVANGDATHLWQVRLRGGGGGTALVMNAAFGPAPIGLQLDGPGADVNGSLFRAPDTTSPERFTTAAIVLGPGADNSFIGSTAQLFPGADLFRFPCAATIGDGCNSIGAVASGAYGILIRGADGVTLRRNSIGGGSSLSGPIEGVPVRFENGPGDDPVQGALVGIEAEEGWNDLHRKSGPAVEVDGGSTGVTIAGNGGLASTSFNAVTSRFTDLLPPAGLGNTTANGGVQPPVVTQATVNGIAGKATPGAEVRVIQQQRPFDSETLGSDPIEGYTRPLTETFVQADDTTGVWALNFPAPINAGQKLLASQTVGGSTSEFASPQDATTEDPDPIAQITSGPTGLIAATSATFTFVADTPGSTFQCSLDGAAYEPCTSPKDYSGLEPGGHQFRVRAIDPLSTIGPPASRAWTIELPGQTTAPGTKTPLGSGGTTGTSGGPGGSAASAAVPLSSVVTLPSAKRCVSRRALRIRLKAPKGTGIAFAKIDVPGRATRTVRGKAISAPVNLRGLPKGRFTVRLRITLLDGRVVKGSRTFRTCAAKKR